MHLIFRYSRFFILYMCLAWGILLPYMLGSTEVSEEEIQAKYLLNFTLYSKKIPSGERPISICHYAKSSSNSETVGEAMQRLTNNSPSEAFRSLKIIAVKDNSNFASCDILYIPESEENIVDEILSKVAGRTLLTVSAAKRFIYKGGMIGFVSEDGKVKIEGNMQNMKDGNMLVDAQLLNVMKTVIRN